jgi:hypothetical protein
MANEPKPDNRYGRIGPVRRDHAGEPDEAHPTTRREDRMRTVTTRDARSAARLMAHQLPGLRTTTTNLIVFGNALADPASWESPRAAWFRSRVWPDVETSLLTLHQDLTSLTGSIAHLDGNTVTVGG